MPQNWVYQGNLRLISEMSMCRNMSGLPVLSKDMFLLKPFSTGCGFERNIHSCKCRILCDNIIHINLLLSHFGNSCVKVFNNLLF